MYQDEQGCWHILEPLVFVRQVRARQTQRPRTRRRVPAPQPDLEYIPHFVFNREHLWHVRSAWYPVDSSFPQYVRKRRFWQHFNPTFATAVHAGIYDEALAKIPQD